MKFFLLVLIFAVFGLSTFSQTLELSYGSHSTPLNYGDTIIMEDSANVSEMTVFVNVKNNDVDSSIVYCTKRYTYIVPGTNNYFCWALTCYPENTYTSPDSVKIGSGQTSTEFSAHYVPNNYGGTSVIKYIFNVFQGDSAYFFVKYIGTVGINDNELSYSISAPYPNPAKSYFNVNYSLVNNLSGTIEVTNVLGKVEKQLVLNNSSSFVSVNVENFHNGIYFCSLKVDGKIVKTNRLVVSH